MTNPNATLRKLKKNLNILKTRQAKYSGNAPLDLLNQIEDHEQAIALTEQAIAGEITEAELTEALKPLLVSLEAAQVYIDQSGQVVEGDQYNVRGDVIQQTGDNAIHIGGDVAGNVNIGTTIRNIYNTYNTPQILLIAIIVLAVGVLLITIVSITGQNLTTLFEDDTISSSIEATDNSSISNEIKFGNTPDLEGRILFTALVGKNRILLSSLADGSERPQVVVEDNVIAASWSPIGDRIVYQRPQASTTEIFVADEDGGHEVQLTEMQVNEHASTPSWFPTGELIFYESNISGKYEIYHTQPAADKASLHRVTMTEKEGENVAPTVSPDGRILAFSHGSGSEWDIYVLELGKTHEWTQLTDAPGSDEYPVWSPDGKHIAFSSHRDGHPEIYIMNVDGSNQQRLTHTPEDKWSRVPTWSPDGHYIAFVSNQRNSFAQLYGDIFVVDVRNTALRQLTFSGKIWTWRVSWTRN